MGALLGKPACAASQKGGYLLQLRERFLRPFEAPRRELFTPSPLGFAQNTINGVGVEKEVLLQVLKIRACPRHLQADLAGQSVTEARRVGEVAEEGHVPSSQVLRHGQPSVPRQLRRAG